MAENAAGTRNSVLKDTTAAEIDYSRRGQIFAAILASVAFVAAIIFFAFGEPAAGGALLSFPVLMLIKSFLLPQGKGE